MVHFPYYKRVESSDNEEIHRRTVNRLDEMSDEEKFQILVDLGIYTSDGELTEKYGGDATPSEDAED